MTTATLDREWRLRALCANEYFDPDDWFPEPENEDTAAFAVYICLRCPVRAQCLADALSSEQRPYGIRGAKTARQRTRMRNGT